MVYRARRVKGIHNEIPYALADVYCYEWFVATKRGREAMDQDRRRFCLHLGDVVPRLVDAPEDVLAGICFSVRSAPGS